MIIIYIYYIIRILKTVYFSLYSGMPSCYGQLKPFCQFCLTYKICFESKVVSMNSLCLLGSSLSFNVKKLKT